MGFAPRFVLIVACLALSEAKNTKLKEIVKWKQMDYAYQTPEDRHHAITSGHFIREHALPLGLEVYKNKLFISVPRWKSGVPSSLNYVDLDHLHGNESPALIPYPNWDMNNITDIKENETKVINTFRIRADACDRLWAIDCGISDILGNTKVLSPTKILIFDLKTDKLLKEYKLKPTDVKDTSFFASITVDVTPEHCDDAYAYLPDLGSNALVVYSLKENDSWKINHHFFHFDPLSGDYNVAGVNFQWTDGLFGVALSPVQEDGYKTMYFHPFSSTREFAVSTKVVQNKTIANKSYHAFRVLGSRGPNSQASATFLDEKSGVVFYTQVNKDAVGCWNSFKHPNEYSADTNGIVAADNETMVFPNDLKVDRHSNLWVLTDRLPTFMYKKLNPDEINYRVLSAPVEEAIKGTACE